MTKIRISKQELKQMIKEEYSKKLTEVKLKSRLKQINEQIEEITKEDELDEVEAGGQGKVRSTGWTGEKNGDEKWNANFQKKGSHLLEDEDEEIDTPEDNETEMDAPEDDMPMDDEIEIDVPGDDESFEGDLDIEAILAKLADAIEDKIETTVGEKMGGAGDEEMEDGSMEDGSMEDGSMENGSMEDGSMEDGSEENIEEQDGTSVAQGQNPKDATPYDNGKANIPGSKDLVSESTKKRMQILSGIKRNDFND